MYLIDIIETNACITSFKWNMHMQFLKYLQATAHGEPQQVVTIYNNHKACQFKIWKISKLILTFHSGKNYQLSYIIQFRLYIFTTLCHIYHDCYFVILIDGTAIIPFHPSPTNNIADIKRKRLWFLSKFC